MRVLLVEDDDAIAQPLAKGLAREGYMVERVASGAAALAAAPADVVLLDLGLPDIDGYEVCRRLRERSDDAHHRDHRPRRGERPGAGPRARRRRLPGEAVRLPRAGGPDAGVTRRIDRAAGGPTPSAAILANGALEVDQRTRRATLDGEELTLTRKEFDLLALLAEDPGALRSREEILETVWDPHWYGPTKTLDVHVASLRKKLGEPTMIETVRGVGFRLRDDR